MEKNRYTGKTKRCVQYLTARKSSPLTPKQPNIILILIRCWHFLIFFFLRLFPNLGYTSSGLKIVSVPKVYKKKINNNNKDTIN